jgi:hypothetical protein
MPVRRKQLVTRPLMRYEYNQMWDDMRKDGIWFKVTRTGYQFYCGQYQITNKSICDVWGISTSALRAIALWLLEKPTTTHSLGEDFEWE